MRPRKIFALRKPDRTVATRDRELCSVAQRWRHSWAHIPIFILHPTRKTFRRRFKLSVRGSLRLGDMILPCRWLIHRPTCFKCAFHLMKAGQLLEPSMHQSKRRSKHLRNPAPDRYLTFHGLAAHQTFSQSARWTIKN